MPPTRSPRIRSLLALLAFLPFGYASVTVYTTVGAATQTAAPLCIGASACDGNVLNPFPNPQPGQGLSQSVPVQLLSGGMQGLGIPVKADFQGFSIELSVANQVLGNQGNNTNPIFLNLMSNIVSRAGRVLVRVGGNSQESAAVVDSLPKDAAIEKINKDAFTPTLLLSPNLIEVMGNISNLVNVDWFIGLPFNDTNNPRTILAEISQKLLGNHLLGMQLGNEPDLYFNNGLRSANYTPQDYFNDFGQVLNDYKNDPNVPNSNIFVAPSVCCGQDIGWTPERVWDTGFLKSYVQNLAYLSVEHYPTNNCNSTGVAFDPNQILAQYILNHTAVIALSTPYVNSANIAQQNGKPFIMFETNTASCGGFSGLSDSFASTLWAVDYNMGMASSNISNALYHVGGESDYYNPFTPPPTNQSTFRQWTVGSTFYAALFAAEAFTQSGKAQVVDLLLNQANDFSPGYAIYEDGQPSRVVLINYLSDNGDGSANYTAYISVGGNSTGQANATPDHVKVKYLLAPDTNEKWNITWGTQTFGGPFESDGRIMGTEFIYTFACDTTNNVCPVTVPAPGAALVFLSDSAQQASEPTATVTYSTSVLTGHNTATIDPAVLATSNGQGGQHVLGLGTTSQESSTGGASPVVRTSAGLASMAVALGSVALFIMRRW